VIACDDGGGCSNGFVCRVGRCCPARSTIATCPSPQYVSQLNEGAIACGTNNQCDFGFACRFGRCCPPGAPLSACPAASFFPTAVTNGSLSCERDGECPNAHGYRCVLGNICCPATGGTGRCAPGAIAAPCLASGQCSGAASLSRRLDQTEECLFRPSPLPLPMGYCTLACNPAVPVDCGGNATCLPLGLARFGNPNTGICVARCRLPDPWIAARATNNTIPPPACRSDRNAAGRPTFLCISLSPTDPTNREGLCIPDCTTLDYCILAGTECNPVTRTCDVRRGM
jgi:hypothetical protein